MSRQSHRTAARLSALVLTLMLAACAAEPRLESATLRGPNAQRRFTHVQLQLGPAPYEYDVAETKINGKGEPFVLSWDDGARYLKHVPANTPATITVGPLPDALKYAQASVALNPKGGGAPTEQQVRWKVVKRDFAANPFTDWQKHRLIVVLEEHGIDRTNEPVIMSVSDYHDEVGSFRDELRIARVDFENRTSEEIPSQVLTEREVTQAGKTVRTCRFAFLADVPANGKSMYLMVYGNPKAKQPTYDTPLTVSKRDDGATLIDNAHMHVELHHKSGQINGMRAKQIGKGKVRQFGFGEYPLHYSPDAWVVGRPWSHVNKWVDPTRVDEVGPIAFVSRRWGTLPDVPELSVHVTYTIFAGHPVIYCDTLIEANDDLLVHALRSDEVVFKPKEMVDHLAWKNPGGDIHYRPIEPDPMLTPGLIGLTAVDAPWAAGVLEEAELGIGGIVLSMHQGSRGPHPATVSTSITAVADYGWGFRYWSRVLVYPWGDFQPDRPTVVSKDTFYTSRIAYTLFPFADGETLEERFAALERAEHRLRSPLRVAHQGAGPW